MKLLCIEKSNAYKKLHKTVNDRNEFTTLLIKGNCKQIRSCSSKIKKNINAAYTQKAGITEKRK